MSALLGFVAEIDGTRHNAALFKITGSDLFWWAWMDANGGTLIHIDLATGQKGVIEQVKDFHGSYHRSGKRHDMVRTSHGKKPIRGRTKTRPEDLTRWESLKSITVPLDQPFVWHLTQGPWKEVAKSITLRKEDFEGACGVTLHGFVCPAILLPELLRQWELECWSAGTNEHRLVVFAEPL